MKLTSYISLLRKLLNNKLSTHKLCILHIFLGKINIKKKIIYLILAIIVPIKT